MTKFQFLLCLFVATITTKLMAQTPLPYTTGFDNAQQQSGWTAFRLGAADPFYLWIYNSFDSQSAPNSLSHNYPVGGTEITDDWFVSPEFDFSNGATVDSIWTKYSGFGLPDGVDTVALYLLTGSNDPELATSRTLLILFSDATYQNDNTWRPVANTNIAPTTGSAYLAFRYHTISNWLDVRFDDLQVSGMTVAVEELEKDNSLLVFPNPTNGMLCLDNEEQHKGLLSIYDGNGKQVLTENIADTTHSIDISTLSSGQYLLQLTTETGSILTKKIIKY